MPASSTDPARVAEELLSLLKIPSVTGHEAALADYLVAWCQARGIAVQRSGASVVARAGAARPGAPKIGLFGHMDTVPGPDDLGQPRREGDVIFGLGASDMKAGLVVQLLLLELARDFGGDLISVFYDKEEGPYADNGLGPLLEARPDVLRLDFAIVLEPTDNQLHLGAAGTLHAEVLYRGVRAHSARPWQGENAVHKAGGLLQRLAALQPRDVIAGGLLFREVMNVTTISGGQARNVIPDLLRININCRFAPGTSPEAAQNWVREVVGQGAEIRFTDVAPAGTVASDCPFFQRLARLTGAEILPKQAWTDVARLGALGVAAVNYGPGRTDQAHKVGEWVSLAETCRSLGHLADFLREIS